MEGLLDVLVRRGEAGGRGIDDGDMATTELGQGWDRAREGRGRKQRELGFGGGVPVLSRERGAWMRATTPWCAWMCSTMPPCYRLKKTSVGWTFVHCSA